MFNRGGAKLPRYLEDYAYLLEAYLTLVRGDVRRAVVHARGRARRGDPGPASTTPSAAASSRRRRRPHGPDRPPQGPRGRADPGRRLGGVLRVAAAGPRSRASAPYENAALSLIALLHPIAPKHPLAFGHLLRAMDFHARPSAKSRWPATPSELARRRPPRLLPARGPRGRRRHRGAAAGGPRAGRRQPGRLRVPAVHVPACR